MRSFSKVIAVNVMSQEDRIYEPLLKIFKTACRGRSLLAEKSLVWTSLCKASSKVQAVVARKQEGESLVSRRIVGFFKEYILIEVAVTCHYSLPPTPCSVPGRFCSILPGTGTVRESKASSTLLGLEGGVL